MLLRWFVSCDENGVKTSPELQYWDSDIYRWTWVPTVEYKTDEKEMAMRVVDYIGR